MPSSKSHSNPPILNPHFAIILGAAIAGSSGAFVKYLQLPPTTMAFFRLAVPTLLLALFFLIKKRKLPSKASKLMWVASFLNATRLFFYFLAFTLTSISNAVIILYTWPIFATLLGAIFLKEKISRRHISLLVLAFLGIILIYSRQEISFQSHDFLGMSSVLLSAFIYALTAIIFKKELTRYSRLETIFYQNLIGAFAFLPFFLLNRPFPTPVQFSVASCYAILIGLIVFILFFSGLRRIKASTASALTYVEVASAIAFGVIIFHETLTWNVILGGLMIIASALLVQR